MVSKGLDKTDDAEKNAETMEKIRHPGHHLAMTVAIDPGDDAGEDDQKPFPEQERAFQGAPQAGDAIIDGSRAGGIEGDVLDGEIDGDQAVNERQAAATVTRTNWPRIA